MQDQTESEALMPLNSSSQLRQRSLGISTRLLYKDQEYHRYSSLNNITQFLTYCVYSITGLDLIITVSNQILTCIGHSEYI